MLNDIDKRVMEFGKYPLSGLYKIVMSIRPIIQELRN